MAEPSAARAAFSDGETTRQQIPQATRRCFVGESYAHLNERDMARDACVSDALIGYQFGRKNPLGQAVLDEANRPLLERQSRMYDGSASVSDKWQQACDF